MRPYFVAIAQQVSPATTVYGMRLSAFGEGFGGIGDGAAGLEGVGRGFKLLFTCSP